MICTHFRVSQAGKGGVLDADTIPTHITCLAKIIKIAYLNELF